jgi:hypothetical protein
MTITKSQSFFFTLSLLSWGKAAKVRDPEFSKLFLRLPLRTLDPYYPGNWSGQVLRVADLLPPKAYGRKTQHPPLLKESKINSSPERSGSDSAPHLSGVCG